MFAMIGEFLLSLPPLPPFVEKFFLFSLFLFLLFTFFLHFVFWKMIFLYAELREEKITRQRAELLVDQEGGRDDPPRSV